VNDSEQPAHPQAWAMKGSEDPRHGTVNGYLNLGCRCPACKVNYSAYAAARYQASKARAGA
jgi:hypothetical protein